MVLENLLLTTVPFLFSHPSVRKFLSRHLAQIKYVLPEAVQIDKILVHDEKTKCMKPELKIALLFDVIEGLHGESVFMDLSNLFSSRLKRFYITHPEVMVLYMFML